MSPRRSTTTATTALTVAVAMTVAFAPAPTVVPDDVPDRGPVLAEPIRRGTLDLTEVAARAPGARTIDGDASDWVGEPTMVGGTSRFDAGELVHTDFLFDAHGADDGSDRARLEQFAGAFHADTRTERIDQLLRTSGSQLGVPEPIGADDEYGDVDGGLDVADLTEVRLASDGTSLHVLASVTNLTDAADLGVLVLADSGEGAAAGPLFGLTTERYDLGVLAADGTTTSSSIIPLPAGVSAPLTTATGAAGTENHLELSIDLRYVTRDDDTVDVAVVAGRMEEDGSFTALNVAFRDQEPVEIWNDRAQAFALLDGTVDAFSSGPVATDDLVRGRTQDWEFAPGGYFERHLDTARPDTTREGGRDGIRQPYGVYVPSSWEPGVTTPATYWLHYRGGKAHAGTVINPRLTTQLGEERDDLVFFPHARGTSEWYVTESHQDVFDVIADAESHFTVDTTRRYVSGYSMGGYGSWLFASLYPDLFAAAFVQSGAITQGLWAGTGAEDDPFDPAFDQGWQEANDGDARAQLTHRAIENLRHVPFAIDHGTDDELVPITGIERMAEKLTRLGYEHRLTRLVGYEHFTQAVVDEWADGAAYLDRFVLDPDPRRVTYSVVPALVHALNTVDPAQDATFDFTPDGAYWVDGIVVADEGDRGDGRPALDAKGTVEAIAHAIEAPGLVAVPDAGAVSPPGHTATYVRTGLQLLADPTGSTTPAVSNALTLELTNVAVVAVDTVRARFDTAMPFTLTVTTDTTVTVRLVDAARDSLLRGPGVEVDGDDLLVTVEPGVTVHESAEG